MVDTLIDIIGREAALFETFLSLLEQQQQALVENNLEELNRITELQRDKMAESQLLNRERERVLAEIKALNAIDGDLTVTRLLEMVDQQQAGQLGSLRTSILELNERILKVRNQNAMLINKSRDYIRQTMEMLSRVASPAGTYTQAGPMTTGSSNVALDRRA